MVASVDGDDEAPDRDEDVKGRLDVNSTRGEPIIP
jgi:hypothetical protein